MANWNNYLTIISTLLGVISAGTLLFSKSIRFRCEILDWRYVTSEIIQVYFHIENNSLKPISVNGVSLIREATNYPCELDEKSVHTTLQGRTWVTSDFPAYFVEGQTRDLLVEFLHVQDIVLIPGKTIDVAIYTNRRSLHRSLTIPEQGRRFRTLLQSGK